MIDFYPQNDFNQNVTTCQYLYSCQFHVVYREPSDDRKAKFQVKLKI